MDGRVLIVPSVKPGNGIGHLRRCLDLLRDLPAAALCFEGDDSRGRAEAVARAAGFELSADSVVTAPGDAGSWEAVILDRRETSLEEFARFSAAGPVVGIDEGGTARSRIPYLIDTLPLPPEHGPANLSSPALLPRPGRVRAPGSAETGRILVSFGGEDPQGLTGRMVDALLGGHLCSPDELAVVVGPLFAPLELPPGVERIAAPPSLDGLLADFDIVCTSFGRTAYEAVNAGVSVILFNPTPYHRTLSRLAGFPEVGIRTVDVRRLRRLLSSREELRKSSSRLASTEQRSIAAELRALSLPAGTGCPVCGHGDNPVVGRFPERSFLRCDRCGMIYELVFSPSRRDYDRAYFFEDYREQYGRTYLEDFDNIRRASRERLDALTAVGGPVTARHLLDVGCAFGPFLVESRAAGAEVYGIDIAEEAVDYVRAELRFPCVNASLEAFEPHAAFGRDQFDLVTMWYVIEHFEGLGRILAKVNGLLPLGGRFAFSTPNASGISGRRDFAGFLGRSPFDHFTIWDPAIARRVLERYGFRVQRVRVTGHHPERFRWGEGSLPRWKGGLLRRYSELAKLGDTFECYAVKESEMNE